MVRKMLAIAGLLVAQSALAADANVTWVEPTKYTDGTAIPVSGTGAVTSYLIEWGTCSTAAGAIPQVLGTVLGTKSVGAPASASTITGLTNATVYCLRMYALVDTIKSAASATVRAWIPATGIPSAPGNVTFTPVRGGP